MALIQLTIRQTQRHRYSQRGDPPRTEQVTYIQSDRRREDLQGWFGYRLRANGRTIFRRAPRTARITRCDLERAFLLNLEDREYTAVPLHTHAERLEPSGAAVRPHNVHSREPTVLVETETLDTGERQELFGRTARRVITTRRIIPLRGAGQASRPTVTDGWYIDLETHIACDPWWRPTRSGEAFLSGHRQGEEPDVPTFRSTGDAERGYLLLGRITWRDTLRLSDGSMTEHVSVIETEVTDLSTAAIDPMVFEVPADFRLVDAIRQDSRPPLAVRWKQAYERLARRF